MSVQKEYRELIRETIDFILSEWDLPPPPTPKKPLTSPLKQVEKPKPPTPPPKPSPLLPKKRLPPKPQLMSDEKGKWTLHPMPFSERKTNRYESCFPPFPLEVPICFVCDENEPGLQLFLESVARATTQRIRPATVVSWETGKQLIQNTNFSLLVAPLAIARSLLPSAEPHVASSWEGKTLLPLAPLSTYTSNPSAKRFLWNQLQTVRIKNTPRSS